MSVSKPSERLCPPIRESAALLRAIWLVLAVLVAQVRQLPATPCDACEETTCSYCDKSAGPAPVFSGTNTDMRQLDQRCDNPSKSPAKYAEDHGIGYSWSDSDLYKTYWWEQNPTTCKCTKRFTDQTTASDSSVDIAWSWDPKAINLTKPDTYYLKCTATNTGSGGCTATTADSGALSFTVPFKVNKTSCTCQSLVVPPVQTAAIDIYWSESFQLPGQQTSTTLYWNYKGEGTITTSFDAVVVPGLPTPGCGAGISYSTTVDVSHSASQSLSAKLNEWFTASLGYTFTLTMSYSFAVSHAAVDGRILKVFAYCKKLKARASYMEYISENNVDWEYQQTHVEEEESYPADALTACVCQYLSTGDTCTPSQ